MPNVSTLGSFGDLAASQIAGAVSALVPSGVVMPYAGTSAPAGWLLCGGNAISRTTYADLFSALSTTYGAGDGSTTFNLPDLRGRTPAGRDFLVNSANADRLTSAGSGITSTTLGAAGGTQTHTLTTAQLATHNHGVTDAGHSHSFTGSGWKAIIVGGSGPFGFAAASGSESFTYPTSVVSSGTGISVNNNGSGNAHQNTQPTLILNYIIKI